MKLIRKISLFEFIYNNRDISNVQLVNDDYSSILCFGRVSQIKDGKTVFVGTNFGEFNILCFFLVFFCEIKNQQKIKLKTSYIHILFMFTIYILNFFDRKFYVTNFFLTLQI